MNIKNFNTVEMLVPIQYNNREGIQTQAIASVTVVRGSDTVITIPGEKHSAAFMEMILFQVMTGFTVDQQPAQKGFPGDNVEVTMSPPTSNDDICMLHIPIQHRDAKEPWCGRCGFNKDYNEPRQIAFGNRNIRPFREGVDVPEDEDTVAGP